MQRFACSALVLSLVSLISALAGCAGSAMRVVAESPTGGAVALQGDGDGPRESAEKYMGAQCPYGYDILGQQRAPDDAQTTIRYACRLPSQDADAKPRESKEVAVHL